MGLIEDAYLRHCLKHTVSCDLPGRLRLTFPKYKLLPKEALPYLHYVKDVMTMLPGVKDTVINPRIGSMLVLYDTEETTPKEIQRWMSAVVDTGLELVREIDWQTAAVDERAMEQKARERLAERLKQR